MLFNSNGTSHKKQSSGFRLDYIEIFNWGTFDEQIWRLTPNCKNSLLTGANGSGKTTLVDAIITLLVPPSKRHYNQSSGANSKKERDETTYTLGAYVTVQSENELSAKTQYLRTKNDFSILLGVFYNKDTRQHFTLAQVRWFSNNSLKRSYLIVPKALTVEDHFTPLDTAGVWKKKLKKKHKGEDFDSFTKYSQKFSKLFGLKSEKALTLFAQTVGIKVLGNLNEFIRTNMLEESDTETEFEKLYAHYENLLSAHKAIEKAKEQLKMLTPIVNEGQKFHKLEDNLSDLKAMENSVAPYFAEVKEKLYLKGIARLEGDVQRKAAKVEEMRKELGDLELKKEELVIAKGKNRLYTQLQNIDKKVQQLENERNSRQMKANRYNQLAQKLGSKSDPTERQFYKILDESKVEIVELQQKLEELQSTEVRHQVNLQTLQNEFNELKERFVSLQKRSNRIPMETIAIRQKILKKLNLREAQLPFAAELLKILESEADWENVVESLLNPIGLSLLVEEKYYDDVTDFVQKNDLQGKILYEKVTEGLGEIMSPKAGKNSILTKVEVKQNHILSDWLQAFLNQHYDYACTSKNDDFKRASKAATVKGLIRNGYHHQKDDRPESLNKENHILGWDNRETILRIQRKMKDLEEEMKSIKAAIRENKKVRSAHNKRRDLLNRFRGFEQFPEIDWKSVVQDIEKQKKEKERLLKSSDQLKELEEQLEAVKRAIADKSLVKDQLIEEKAKLQNTLSNYEEGLKEAQDLIAEQEDMSFKNYRQKLKSLMGEKAPTISSVNRIEAKVKRTVTGEKEKLEQNRSKKEVALTRKMQQFINPTIEVLEKYPNWTADTVNFRPDVGYLKDYEELYQKVLDEDLPQYQKRFKDWLNERLIFDIANFKTALENKETTILDSIEQINDSLRGIDFNNNPQTYIELDIQKSRDIAIREFKQMLRDAMPDPAKLIKGDEQELEHSFQKIKKIIEELSANEWWRKKVTDVRNWLEFAAIERYREDNVQRQYYADSQALSGGEKAKLAYTILASAIAYQFGIRHEDARHRSFRFAVVDEAFSKVDPENSIYAMELFKQLNLQLMVVTPLDKINLAEPYIHSVHFVQNKNKRNSKVFDLPMKVYLAEKERIRGSEE